MSVMVDAAEQRLVHIWKGGTRPVLAGELPRLLYSTSNAMANFRYIPEEQKKLVLIMHFRGTSGGGPGNVER
jgi:hypothetical protein